MLSTDLIKLLAKYNQETNKRMNEIIRTLTDDEWDRGLGGFYTSVRSLCSHLYIGDYNWLKRFRNLRDYPSLRDQYLSKTHNFGDLLFSSREEYFAERPKLDALIGTFIGEVSEEDLRKNLVYKNYQGKEIDKNAGGLLLHMFNHQTHHRGMISVYLEILGKENDFSGLVSYL